MNTRERPKKPRSNAGLCSRNDRSIPWFLGVGCFVLSNRERIGSCLDYLEMVSVTGTRCTSDPLDAVTRTVKVPRVGFRSVEMVSVAVATPPAGATVLGVMETVMPVVLASRAGLRVTGCEKPLSEAMLMVMLTVCRLDIATAAGEAVAEKSVT